MVNAKLQIYNTMTGKKEDFTPAREGHVGMYVCGPTTYNYIHLGNARPLVVFDTVRRYLEYVGYSVTYIQNFTDVDDKIIRRAAEENVPPLELAARYIKEYFADADTLNVKRATVHPKVSEHMTEIISFVQGLVDKGLAYVLEGDVYFAVDRFAGYGKLSGRTLEELQAGARVDVDERKENPADFALWKKAKPGEPSWSSPWGLGRPGWHIECSAMSYKYLGPGFDIHAGGFDLIFPHHENEIAQSEGLYGSPMTRYWMHNGFITVNQEKMSKSLGNFFLLRDILRKFPAQVVRFYLLSTHYRSQLDFDDEKLEVAQRGLERLQNSFRLLKEELAKSENLQSENVYDHEFAHDIKNLEQKFLEAMNDDFNTALAIATLFDMARTINSYLAVQTNKKVKADQLMVAGEKYLQLAGVLGLEPAKADSEESDPAFVAYVEGMIRKRQEAKTAKDYKTADAIREQLKEKGVLVEDTPQGPRWRKQ